MIDDPKETPRGFKQFEPIKGHFANGTQVVGSVQVGESSCAWPASVHVWVEEDANLDPTDHQAHVQLDLDAATVLRDQLTWLIENHYQVKPREEPA